MTADTVVADVGSGTGILSALFLDTGNPVLGVEPNEKMREAAERLLGEASPSRSASVAGSAEATTLASGSVDLVVAGNSLHWAEPDAARAEFSRILKPGGRVAIIWNIPQKTGTPFLEDVGRLVSRYRTNDGAMSDAEDTYEMTEVFFEGSTGGARRGYEVGCFPNAQPLDLASLKGLVLSYSSIPAGDEPGSRALLRDLEEIFRANESDGEVVMEYVARVYCGRLP